jgi:Zinc-finger of C2H2 type
MSDTPDFSTFNWPNSQHTSNAEPPDPTSFSQHASYTTQPSQHPSDSFHHDSPPINGSSNTGTGADSSSSATGGPAARGENSSSDYANFTFGQPSGASGTQSDSQGGYYSINGGIDPSQTNYGADAAGGYGPIDPALTAAPTRGGTSGGNSFSHGNTSQSSGGGSSYLHHLPPANFNQGRRYSVPAISSTTTAPYSIPKRQNMYPPGIYGNRSSLDPALTSSTSFAQPPPRSPASFSSPLRSFQQGGSYTNLDRRMSMPTNSLWQLAHQTTSQAPQTQSSPVAPHTDPRPRQHSMVDWRLGQTMPSRAAAQPANTLLADLDASQGMLSLRGQWGTHSQGSDPSLDFGSEFQEDGRRGSYADSGLLAGTPTMYDPSGRRASVDSNATQPGSVLGDGMKKHACPLCQKKFTRPSSLQTHMYSHTGEKRISPTPLFAKDADFSV